MKRDDLDISSPLSVQSVPKNKNLPAGRQALQSAARSL